jgi:ESF2/ABP1 family protein
MAHSTKRTRAEDVLGEGDSPHEDTVPDLEAAATAGPSRTTRTSTVKPVKRKKPEAPSPGIIYISRLPPGMTPQKVRHLMARWGEVGKVYAQPRDGKPFSFVHSASS